LREAQARFGVPLIRALVAAGHQVTASTRSAANAAMLKGLGATPAIVDALDADALTGAVVAAHPTHVIHQLTALPKGGARSARDLVPTNRLRTEGTRHLIAAAVAAGATRIVGGSFAPIGSATNGLPAELEEAAAAVRSMESQILDDQSVSLSEIVRSIADLAGAPRPIEVPAWLPRLVAPYMAKIVSLRLALSNARARAELGWHPKYPTMRDGLRQAVAAAA
jgi:nucleoside-diphosphate-sugar epimerase